MIQTQYQLNKTTKDVAIIFQFDYHITWVGECNTINKQKAKILLYLILLMYLSHP